MEPMKRILIAEDQTDIRDLLALNLQGAGYQVVQTGDGREALAAHERQPADLLVLDLMMPHMDGLDVCKTLRARGCNTPILMLTAKSTELDRVLGLELGADDYLSKPFEARELLARIKALLRRASPEPAADEVLRFGRLEIDLGARQARIDGKPADLTGHQFDLLVVLAQSAGRVLSRDQIMDALKGHPMEAFDRSIDVHVSRIRACIEDDPKCPKRVLTVRGSGYVFARKQDADE